ncbi:MAG TPA: hypothetical protein VKO63_05955 [Chitinispirillaceae bacterium]|nr:hypothetical protein [Chitinispirillaceae bacterium]
MEQVVKNCTGLVEVEKTFYMSFDGKRCVCTIPELYIDNATAQMLVRYKQGDEEVYRLTSTDGIRFTGKMGTDDDSRVDFDKWEKNGVVLLAGSWKCGGREGEWYIEGTKEGFTQ